MTQQPVSKLTRQQRRAMERSMVRKTMDKNERKALARLSPALRREVITATVSMLAQGYNPDDFRVRDDGSEEMTEEV